LNRENLLEWARKKGPNTPYRGKTPLRKAMEAGDLELAIELLEMGARIEGSHAVDVPLFFIGFGQGELLPRAVKILTKRVAEQIEERLEGRLPFYWEDKLIEDLLYRINTAFDRSPYYRKDIFLNLEALTRVLVRAEAEGKINRAHQWLRNIIPIAVFSSLEAVRTLREWGVPLKNFPEMINLAFSERLTREQRLRLLKFLLIEEEVPPEDSSPLAFAAEEDDFESVQLLLDCGANPFQKNYSGKYITEYCKSPQMLSKFMALGVPVELTKGNLPALCEVDPVLAIQLLKEKLPTLERSEAMRMSYLVFERVVVARDDGKERLLAYLELFDGIDLPVYALDPLEFKGDLEKMFLLEGWLRSKGLGSYGGWIELAIRLGANREEIKEFTKEWDKRRRISEAALAWRRLSPFDRPGDTERYLPILIWLSHELEGAYIENTAQLRAYLEAGGNPNARTNEEGHTLLQKAIAEDDVAAVSMLLEWKADPNLKDYHGTPPTHFLLPHGRVEKNTEKLFALLALHGAELDAIDKRARFLKDLVKDAIRSSQSRGNSRWEISLRKELREFLKKISNPEALVQKKLLEDLAEL